MSARTLTADCSRCCALCCVAHSFDRSAEFALSKRAHTPCPHLGGDFRCGVHDDLGGAGFRGCASYDCLGAGQHVTQDLFGGRSWSEHDDPGTMLDVFLVVRRLFEQLSLLETALALDLPADLRRDLHARRELVRGLVDLPPGSLLELDPEREEAKTRTLLRKLAPHAHRPRRELPVLVDSQC